MSKIVLIGSGNVAYHLAVHLSRAKHHIVQVFSRKPSKARALRPYCRKVIADLEHLDTSAHFYILAVKDDAIAEIASKLQTSNSELRTKIFCHTSGSAPMDALKGISENYGVFWPLQTFSKSREIDFSDIPILIEYSNEETKRALAKLADSISKKVFAVNEKERETYHLAAVFANNFTDHLLVIAENLLKKKKLPFDILVPLVEETVNKVKERSPTEMQTGPAIRGDKKTIAKHLRQLSKEKTYHKIYSLLSESIGKMRKSS